MEFFPRLELGWLNGWIPLAGLVLTEGFLLLLSDQAVRARLFDRSRWNTEQRIYTVLGKLFSLLCLVLIVLTPLKLGSPWFIVGMVIYALGWVGLVWAILDFKNTPLDQPVTKGLYRVSRHPQIVMLFVIFLGISIAIGSWTVVLALILSRAFQHLGILGEESACLDQYGESYREYMSRVPRYFLIF